MKLVKLLGLLLLTLRMTSGSQIVHSPTNLQVEKVQTGAKLSWDFNLPDTVISYNNAVPFGIWGPRAKQALGVVFDLSNIAGATLEEVDFAYYGRELLHGPYYYAIHIFDMDSMKVITRIDSLIAEDAYDQPVFAVGVPLGSIAAGGRVGIFVEGLSSPDQANYLPSLVTDSTDLVRSTSYYCVDVNDPFLASDPNYTNMYELNEISASATNIILDLWLNISGSVQKLSSRERRAVSNPAGAPWNLPDYVTPLQFTKLPPMALSKKLSDQEGFYVFRGDSAGNLAKIAVLDESQYSFVDTTVKASQSYVFGVARFSGDRASKITMAAYHHAATQSLIQLHKDENQDFIVDQINEVVYTQGIINSPNLSAATEYFMQTDSAGIRLLSHHFSTQLDIGDKVFVKGRLLQPDGLLTIEPDSMDGIEIMSSGNPVDTVRMNNSPLAENYEGRLVCFTDVQISNPGAWPAEGSDGTEVILDDGQQGVKLFIDSATDLDGWNPPQGNIKITGIVGQATSNEPPSDGYFLIPRFRRDIEVLTGLDSGRDINPGAFSLFQNYPNPFNPSTTIFYRLPARGEVDLSVIDLQGRQVSRLVKGIQAGGVHKVVWNTAPQRISSGVYFYRLMFSSDEGEFITTRKLVLLR